MAHMSYLALRKRRDGYPVRRRIEGGRGGEHQKQDKQDEQEENNKGNETMKMIMIMG